MLPDTSSYVLICMLWLYDVMRCGIGVLATVYMNYDDGGRDIEC